MDDPTAFITARLDEEETAHHHAGEGRIAWLSYRLDNGEFSHTTVAADHHDGYWCADGKLLPEPASVLVVYDQAQALREIAAKRAIVAEHVPIDPCDAHDSSLRTIPCDTLLHLAAVWSDHPDYDQAWRP